MSEKGLQFIGQSLEATEHSNDSSLQVARTGYDFASNAIRFYVVPYLLCRKVIL
jgi:hypothetical protein